MKHLIYIKKITGYKRHFGNSICHVQLRGQEASDLIKAYIQAGEPLMISRFGSTELSCILNFHFKYENRNLIKFIRNIVNGVPYGLKWNKNVIKRANIMSGFFPPSIKALEKFARMSIRDAKEIDILGSWLKEERYVFQYMKKHRRVRLEDLLPFNHESPWSEALKDKKVLVVHPFTETIKSQFKKKNYLFKDKRVLPDFELRSFRAVQTIAGTKSEFKDWFEALDHMTDRIKKIDFDIAILGCGAYGMPLANRIKKMGKQAIHLGGATQCLFGIKGTRWESCAYNYQEKYYNDFWVRPRSDETPQNAKKVEDGCYW